MSEEIILRRTICPLCNQFPGMVIGETAVCGNIGCEILFWDMSKTLDENLENAGYVEWVTENGVEIKPTGSE
jgi:hypothetical protein